ncbi:hypothetical protein DXG03_000603 [Asterophora parasitica]|uniref:Uncharacterized protein n=1 Tax=Asterophora parasitica TaxID=117018 RepID=A0A9P7G6B6_9AGAR|nr:hypothetical protein DXG03_000603 [Asterophora parasitica]
MPETTPEPELAGLLSVPTATDQRRRHLGTLTMGNWIALHKFLEAVEYPTSTLSLVRLQTFHAHVVQKEDIAEISKIINVAGPSLRSLPLTGASLSQIPDIQSLTNVKRLRFSIDNLRAQQASDWMCQFLEALPEQNSVRTVYIDAPRLRDPYKADWARIDDLLKRERHEKELQYVALDLDRALEMLVALSMPKLDMDPARDSSRVLSAEGPGIRATQ